MSMPGVTYDGSVEDYEEEQLTEEEIGQGIDGVSQPEVTGEDMIPTMGVPMDLFQ
jgi:hypothetical protein